MTEIAIDSYDGDAPYAEEQHTGADAAVDNGLGVPQDVTEMHGSSRHLHEGMNPMDAESAATRLDRSRFPLHAAALDGNISALATASAAPDAVCGDGRSYLTYAVIGKQRLAVERMLELGADLNLADNLGRTPAHWAAAGEDHKLLKLLVDSGANWESLDSDGRNLLHWAALAESTKCMNVIMKQSSELPLESLNTRDKDGFTALHWATLHGRAKHSAILLKAGADSTIVDNEGKTALHWAVDGSNEAITGYLTSMPDVPINAADIEGGTPLHIAVSRGVAEIVEILFAIDGIEVNALDNLSRSAMHWAAAGGKAEVLRILQQNGAQPDIYDSYGATALHYAVQGGHDYCVHYLVEGDASSLPDADGRHPVHWAALQGHTATVGMLLNAIPELVEMADAEGRTPLHMASLTQNVELLEGLLQMGANPNTLDLSQKTPVFAACEVGAYDCLVKLVDAGADLLVTDLEGQTAMHWACVNGFVDGVSLLLQAGVPLDIPDHGGKTSLMYASYQGHGQVVAMLIDSGATVDIQDNEGVSALHWAALEGNMEIVSILLEVGAYPNYMEANGSKSTPLDYALSAGHHETAELLVQYAAMSIADIENLAALTIQATWRGYQGRHYAKSVRVANAASPEEHDAAAKIQAVFHGYVVRKKKAAGIDITGGFGINTAASIMREARTGLKGRIEHLNTAAGKEEKRKLNNRNANRQAKFAEKRAANKAKTEKSTSKPAPPPMQKGKSREKEKEKDERKKASRMPAVPKVARKKPQKSRIETDMEEAYAIQYAPEPEFEWNSASETYADAYNRYAPKFKEWQRESDRAMLEELKRQKYGGHHVRRDSGKVQLLMTSKQIHDTRVQEERRRELLKQATQAAGLIQRNWRIHSAYIAELAKTGRKPKPIASARRVYAKNHNRVAAKMAASAMDAAADTKAAPLQGSHDVMSPDIRGTDPNIDFKNSLRSESPKAAIARDTSKKHNKTSPSSKRSSPRKRLQKKGSPRKPVRSELPAITDPGSFTARIWRRDDDVRDAKMLQQLHESGRMKMHGRSNHSLNGLMRPQFQKHHGVALTRGAHSFQAAIQAKAASQRLRARKGWDGSPNIDRNEPRFFSPVVTGPMSPVARAKAAHSARAAKSAEAKAANFDRSTSGTLPRLSPAGTVGV